MRHSPGSSMRRRRRAGRSRPVRCHMQAPTLFDRYLALWNLVPDGDVIVTPAARLLPVRRSGEAAMLKVATEAEERFGGVLMAWWDGDGAARVLAAHGDAILL